MIQVGLTEQELALICSVLRHHPQITGALLFGSRAKGISSAGSDVDLALLGVDDPLLAESVASEMDELPLPYRFDVKAYEAIRHAPLRAHIERVGVRIFG
jgi:predicted nucleotidyltransferase